MRILDLHIDGFGKFNDLSVSFDKDLNVVYGRNEAGKSTLHTFIRCMLFGLERGRGRAAHTDLYSKYEPWQNKAVYGGQMRVEKDGVIYRLERNFQKDQKSFVIVNETAGKEVEPTKGFLDFLLGGLTETAYNNTISIGQLMRDRGRHGNRAAQLYCQHEHHRQPFLEHYQGHHLFEEPEKGI